MEKSGKRDGDPFVSIQGALAKLLRTAPQSRIVVAQILELLEEILAGRQQVKLAIHPSAKSSTARPHRGEAIQGYEIADTARGPVLIERRYGTVKDFRCPKDVYDDTAKVMEGLTEGLAFDQILHAVGERLKDEPPDYLCRICLRFWLGGPQPIISRFRSRYKPVSPNRFSEQAQRAWRNLASK